MKCVYCDSEIVAPVLQEMEPFGVGQGRLVDGVFKMEQVPNVIHAAMTIKDDKHGTRVYPMYECAKCGFMFLMRKPDQ